MFAGIDIASERHVLARLDAAGAPIGSPCRSPRIAPATTRCSRLLGAPPVLIAMEATGHYWKNLFAVLTAAGHEVALLNPFAARRFQDASLERTKTDAIDADGLARLAFEKRPAPTRLHDEAAESLRELVRHRDRLRQDFDDRVRQLHRWSISASPSSPATSAASTACSPAPPRRISHRAGLRSRQPRASRQTALRRPPLVGPSWPTSWWRRRSARSASITARPTRCRPATSARTSTLAPPPGRDRARHRGPARRPRGRQAAT